ncbi:MAG TPA: HTTM domain-containing protein [Kofleriaceae bacterium]|nr:HTTM domain-containing protein [Kofleriaceae bacterium]
MKDLGELLDDQIQRAFAPQPIVRLEVVRIFSTLAILGFMSTRIIHADDWLSTAGFRIPDLANDYRQPAHFAALSPALAWSVAIALVIAGLMTAAGAFTRWSSGAFCLLCGYVALADRMSAFTVSKIAPVIALALCLSPSGTRWSIDAWRRRRRDPKWRPPTHVSGGCVRFFQIMLPVFYCSSGIQKAYGDWLHYPYVLFTHLHDSYQTPVSWFAANYFPTWSWTVMQAITLVFEALAPIWFALRWTRPYAFVWGLAMHAMIGLMFGPVAWFSLLMMSLLVASYAPATLLDPTLVRLERKR